MNKIIKKIKKLGFKLGIKKLVGYEALFSCAFCRREAGAELYTGADSTGKEFVFLPHSRDYWYADPLVLEREGKERVFLERVDRHTGKGCIAWADITEGRWTEPAAVIEEPFHMSFPLCFEWRGELYMLPETEMSESIHLYRCVQFPDQWEKAGEYLQGQRLVDSVILEKDESRIKVLASEYQEEDDFYTRFHCYEIRWEKGEIAVRDLGRLREGYTLDSRAAGPVIFDKTQILPLQRSTKGIYGYSVEFHELSGALPGRLIRELLPEDIAIKGKKLMGVHTYSCSTHYEVIDVQYLVFNKNKWRKR